MKKKKKGKTTTKMNERGEASQERREKRMSRSSGRKEENSSNEVESVVPVSSASADSKPAAANHESGSAQTGEQRKRSRFSLNRLWRYSAGDHRPTDKLDTHAEENGKPAKRRSIRLDLFGRRNKTDQPTTTHSLDLPATETSQAAAAARGRQASKQRHQEAGLSRSARETRAVLAPSSPSRSHNAKHQHHHPRDQRGGGRDEKKKKKRIAVEGLDLAVAREHRGASGSASARGASSRIGGDKERRERRADNSEGGKSRPDKGEGRGGSRIDRDRDRDRAKGDAAEKKGAERESKNSRTPRERGREAKDSKDANKEANKAGNNSKNNNREQLQSSSRDVRDKDRDARERKPARDDKEKEKEREGKRERERDKDSREQRKQERSGGGGDDDKDKQRERRGTDSKDSKDEKKERHRGRDRERDPKERRGDREEKKERDRDRERKGADKEKEREREKEGKRAASTTKGTPEAAALPPPAPVVAGVSRPVSQRAEAAGPARERSGSLRRRSRRPDDDKDRCTPDRAAKDEHPTRDHDKVEEKREEKKEEKREGKEEGKAQVKPRRNTTSAKKDDGDGKDKEADRGNGVGGEGGDATSVHSDDVGQGGDVVGDNVNSNGGDDTDKKANRDPEPLEEGSSIDESPFARELAKRANQNREQKLTQMEQMLATKKTKGPQRPKRSTPAAGAPKKAA